MPVPFSGDMLNAPPVTPSLAGELNTFNRSAPSMGQVAGAFVSDVFQGNGSAAQDIQRLNFNNALDTQNPISPEDWKVSPNYREGLQYYPGMTDKAAEILAQNNDDKNAREYVMSKASGLQTVAGFGVALGAGLFEPKNLASGIAAGAITEGLGAVVPSIKRVLAIGGELGRYKSLAIAGATEGAIATALTEPSNRESARIMQNDYTMADSLLNFGLSTVLGGAIHAGVGKFKDVRAAKLADEGIKVASDIPEVRAKEFDASLAQMTEGRQVDVEHVGEIDNAKLILKAQNDLPKLDEQISIAQKELGLAPEDVQRMQLKKQELGRSINNQDVFFPDERHAELYDYATQYLGKENVNAQNAAKKLIQSFNDVPVIGEEPYIKTRAQLDELAHDYISGNVPTYLDSKRPNDLLVIDENAQSAYLADILTREKFNNNDPRLIDLEKAEARRRQAEANSQLTADKEPITRAINDATKPDNSTAYSPKDIKDVSDYLDQFGHEDDRTALENSLQMAQEDIQAMKDEGMLSGEQLAILDKLTEIDDGINLHDNILRSAFLCLTRG